MKASKIQDWLIDKFNDSEFEEEFGTTANVVSYEEGGYLTHDNGFVVKFDDKSTIQITIVGYGKDDDDDDDDDDDMESEDDNQQ